MKREWILVVTWYWRNHMLIETLSTTGRKVTFPMGSDGSPTMKYTTLLVSIVKSFRKGIGGYLVSFPFPCLKLSQDLGNTTQYRQPSTAPGCEAVEGSLGKETGGDKYYVFVEVIELCHKTMNWFKKSSCFWMASRIPWLLYITQWVWPVPWRTHTPLVKKSVDKNGKKRVATG